MGGAGWLLEGARGRLYHAANRVEPLSPAFRDTADFLLVGLANVSIESLPVRFEDQHRVKRP
jgi:hypothetical protein